MRCCATCRGHRSLRWRRSRFSANGAAPCGGRRLSIMGLAGRDGFAGDAVNPSMGLGRGIHAADTPANPSRPATDSFRVRPPRKRKRRSKAKADRFASLARSRAWLGSTERQCAGNCRRRGGSDGGGVSRMDAATKPPWTDSRRPPPSDPPRQPAAIQLLLLLLPLQVQGCKPCKSHYVTQPAITSRARIASHSSSIRHTRLIASRRSGSRCHTGNNPASV